MQKCARICLAGEVFLIVSSPLNEGDDTISIKCYHGIFNNKDIHRIDLNIRRLSQTDVRAVFIITRSRDRQNG